ncbi:hypothetical protein JIN84_05750 [Luteolibacter yonseiensis]|uniref:Uncharacterized protein n=2 Tax=Luteolibacter yonseiensis TaxID=1144680 RepID=A0A934VAF6_9BACT|nr:hypothetical protein [Luteolibacter yonseiensis]MBK1815105.1 hypothetical protein [Luteolibacter yonseiensis]
MIDNAGRLFRKGEHIGDLEGDTMRLLPEKKKYTAAVTRWLREEAAAAEGEAAGDGPAPAAEESAPVAEGAGAGTPGIPTPAELEAMDSLGLDREAREQVLRARALYQDDLDFAARTGCPPPPKKNPQYGDKTPAFVEWLHEHRHDQFIIRYGVTGRGRVPVLETNPQTGMDEVTGYRETYFARRKTHLTERDSSRDGLSEDMDWNA